MVFCFARSRVYLAVAAFAALCATKPAGASDKPDPAADANAFRNYFVKKFPNVKLEDFVNGPYALDQDMRRQWEEKEQFPPYEFSLETGKARLCIEGLALELIAEIALECAAGAE